MPRLPTYQQQTTPGATLNVNVDTGSRDVVRGMAVLAHGLNETARSLKYVEEVQQRKAEADAISETHLAEAEGQAKWETHLVERMQAADGDPAGFTENLLTDYDKYAAELVGKARTPAAKQYARMHTAQFRSRLVSRALPWEAEKGIKHRAGQYERTIDAQRIVVRADPDEFDAVLERQGAALNALSLPVGVRDELWARTKESVAASAVETLIDRNPARAMQALRAAPGESGSTAVESLTADSRERALRQAEGELRRREAEARARAAEARGLLREQEADAMAAAASGLPATLPSRSAYVAAFGPEGAARYGQATKLLGAYEVASSAVLLPPAEAAAEIEKYKPTTQAGAAEASQAYAFVARMYAEQRKAFEADPAGAIVARDPQIRTLLDAALAPDATPAAWTDYARRVQSVQTAAGIAEPKMLPAPVAEQVASRLTFNPEKPDERTRTLQAMQAQFGQAFPSVVREVAPKLDGTARVLVGMTPENGKRLDAALASGADVSKALPKADQRMVTEALQAELQPFAATLADNIDFERRYAEHYEAAQVLAMSLAARGESPRAAAKKAAEAVINEQYQYQGTVRIPKSRPADSILAGADVARAAAIGPERLAIQASTFSDDDQAQADLKAAIRKGGYWVTNEDESGLVLMVPTQRGTTAVRRADGSRYELTWDEAAALSVAAPVAIPEKAWRK